MRRCRRIGPGVGKREEHLKKAASELKRIYEGSPVLLQNIEFVKDSSGKRSLFVITRNPNERDKRNFILRWLVPASPRKQLRLDPAGTFVASRITGKHKTKDIIKAFRAEFDVDEEKARSSCLLFLHSLARRGIIAVIES